jgi:hypothetical protein
MAKMKLDLTDVALLFVSFVAVTAMASLAAWDVYGIALSDPIFKAANYGFLKVDLTTAYVGGLGAWAATIMTNENAELTELYNQETYDGFDNGQLYWIAIVASGALFLAWPFFPGIESFVIGEDAIGLLVVGATLISQAVVGFLL